MLYVVMNDETKLILGRWDGWYIHARDEAYELIESKNLQIVKEEVTFMGDLVIWVS